MLALDFVKMHGLGNSFIIIQDFGKFLYSNQFKKLQKDLFVNSKKKFQRLKINQLALEICSSEIGIGSDGLVVLTFSEKNFVDFKMNFYNADGTEAEMCGNAIRCLAKYIFDQKLSKKKKIFLKLKKEILHQYFYIIKNILLKLELILVSHI